MIRNAGPVPVVVELALDPESSRLRKLSDCFWNKLSAVEVEYCARFGACVVCVDEWRCCCCCWPKMSEAWELAIGSPAVCPT